MKITTCVLPDEPDVFETAWAALCRHTHDEHSDLVVLPELAGHPWLALLPDFDEALWQEALAGQRALISRLSELGAGIVVASRAVEDAGKRHNEGYYWTSGTGPVGIHRKYYIPEEPGFHETRWFHRPAPGFEVASLPDVALGLLVCTDVMFNERARQIGREGATVLAVPRTADDQPCWPVALGMAAVASGAFTVSSNRFTTYPERSTIRFGGAGVIISPDGEVLAATSPDQPYVSVEVNLEDAVRAKRTYPRYVSE